MLRSNNGRLAKLGFLLSLSLGASTIGAQRDSSFAELSRKASPSCESMHKRWCSTWFKGKKRKTSKHARAPTGIHKARGVNKCKRLEHRTRKVASGIAPVSFFCSHACSVGMRHLAAACFCDCCMFVLAAA